MKSRTTWITAIVVCSLFLLAGLRSIHGAGSAPAVPKMGKRAKHSSVYVCACLKTKSCSCMSEAKMEGPCACGTQGGPPMKKVASNSAWAKHNREVLAK